jgi:hypothetical protein
MLLLRSGSFVYESLLRGLLGPKDPPGLLTWSSPAKQKLRHIHPHPTPPHTRDGATGWAGGKRSAPSPVSGGGCRARTTHAASHHGNSQIYRLIYISSVFMRISLMSLRSSLSHRSFLSLSIRMLSHSSSACGCCPGLGLATPVWNLLDRGSIPAPGDFSRAYAPGLHKEDATPGT